MIFCCIHVLQTDVPLVKLDFFPLIDIQYDSKELGAASQYASFLEWEEMMPPGGRAMGSTRLLLLYLPPEHRVPGGIRRFAPMKRKEALLLKNAQIINL